ncbi:MAG: hypothetical protein AW08_03034 [Candidatus Accumulibacter adjunctus]|uniref:STAS domain-containing protein n=1 Tax=Candidatus Accumulibacter adjunctus TaxID=1454001 RepID=A0A011M7K8_9PROT|nr:MAG: hypothetical protein AW08_03034 [Candidatus Accumulibacter adjunctus]
MLRDTSKLLEGQGISLVFAHVSPAVREQFDRYGLTAVFGADAFYGSLRAVVDAWEHMQDATEATPANGQGG